MGTAAAWLTELTSYSWLQLAVTLETSGVSTFSFNDEAGAQVAVCSKNELKISTESEEIRILMPRLLCNVAGIFTEDSMLTT